MWRQLGAGWSLGSYGENGSIRQLELSPAGLRIVLAHLLTEKHNLRRLTEGSVILCFHQLLHNVLLYDWKENYRHTHNPATGV